MTIDETSVLVGTQVELTSAKCLRYLDHEKNLVFTEIGSCKELLLMHS